MLRLTFGRKWRFLVTLFLITVITGVCINRGREQVELTATQPSHLPVLSVQSFWPQALAVAQEWHPDAYVRVVWVDVLLPAREAYPEGYLSVRFSFQSPGENYVTLVILCNAEKCHSFEV